MAPIAAVLFAITAARMLLGARLTALAALLPFGAYPFLAITLPGWARAHLRTRPARNAAPRAWEPPIECSRLRPIAPASVHRGHRTTGRESRV